MINHASNEEPGETAYRQHELFRPVRRGTLNTTEVGEKLQVIIETSRDEITIKPYNLDKSLRVSFRLRETKPPS